MSLVVAEHLSKEFQGYTILEDLSFAIERGDRIGLVGINGSGKTTLMRMILGDIAPDSGTLSRASSLVISYLEQRPLAVDLGTSDVLENTRFTAMEQQMKVLEHAMQHLEGDALREATAEYSRVQNAYEASGVYDYRARLAKVLSRLGLSREKMLQPYETLSGGEKMRVALGRFLLRRADLMLLDEPTNHLDLFGIEWLQSYLASSRAAMMVVSHDRRFLDEVCTRVFDLEGKKLFVYQGNYTSSLQQKKEREAERDRTMDRLGKEIERQQDVAQTMLSHRKMKSYHSREKVVRKLKDEMRTLRDGKAPKRRMTFSVTSSQEKKDAGRMLLKAEGLSLAYDRPLFRDVDLTVRAEDRIALLGPNGCGKTSLLEILLGYLDADAGKVSRVGHPKMAFMGQLATFDDETLTVYQWLQQSFPRTETAIRARLAQYGFREESMTKRLASLSGGERHRLNLCSLLEQAPDLMVLDEPTNHLDIESRVLLEEALVSFKGAVIVVSHDRAFIEATATRILGFVGTAIRPFDRYEDWRDAAMRFAETPEDEPSPREGGRVPPGPDRATDRANAESSPELSADPAAAGGRSEDDARPLNPAERRRARAAWRRRVSELEEAIHAREGERDAFEHQDPSTLGPEDYARYAALLSKIEELYASYFRLLEQEDGEPTEEDQ